MMSRDEEQGLFDVDPEFQFTGDRKRLKKLTPKAQEQFTQSVLHKLSTLGKCWAEILQLTKSVSKTENTETNARTSISILEQQFTVYTQLSHSFIDFLERTRTEESLGLKNEHLDEYQQQKQLVELTLYKLNTMLASVSEISPNSSYGSSSAQSKAANARAKAEAAKARLSFMEKEAKLKQQKAVIETELDVIAAEKDAAIAVAEADALEAYGSSRRSRSSLISLPSENKSTRTKNYVETVQSHKRPIDSPPVSQQDVHVAERVTLNPSAPPFSPQINANTDTFFATEITKLLLKKDLLFASLTTFNDSPENYQSWKCSFKDKMKELSVTPLEEMDLLTKWTGATSKQQVIALRSAYFNAPSKGVREIWKRLDERFGSPDVIESSLKKKLTNFPKLSSRDTQKLYELADILTEIEAVKSDTRYSSVLAYFDSSTGVSPVVCKLPYSLQEKWTATASKYMGTYNVTYPPFTCFCDFIRQQSCIRNNPSFSYDTNITRYKDSKPNIHSRKTTSDMKESAVPVINNGITTEICPVHNTNHSLLKCKRFKSKPIDVRRRFLQDRNLCFRCCLPGHTWSDCKNTVKCDDCGSNKHSTAMHVHIRYDPRTPPGNQDKELTDLKQSVTSACAQICGNSFKSKSCSKIVPVWIWHSKCLDTRLKVYALIDDQSNKSLVKPELLDRFTDICTFPEVQYSLTSCAGVTQTSGRRANGFVIQSLDQSVILDLPVLTECSQIPQDKDEIPTPDIARYHPHLCDIAKDIHPLDPECDILLLLGRDIVEVHHVQEQRIGSKGSPYAQRLNLGWVVIGETCLGGAHRPEAFVSTFKTHLHSNGRPSLLPPCPYQFNVKVDQPENRLLDSQDIFERNLDSERPGRSIEDSQFLHLMEAEFKPDLHGNWTAPLPFKSSRQRLPNNRQQAWKRAQILHNSLEKNDLKKEHFFKFMNSIIEDGHAEIAPPLNPGEECWYLPLFGVYHPKKRDKIRGVFDSSAVYDGASLNETLLKGPDLTNNLVGVLLRFRQGTVAISCDIEQMFYCFGVREDHRNFLRFFWYKNNRLSEPLIEYRMCKHVFGNKPSPAVANFGLRRIVIDADDDVKEFVDKNFYVDDGLTSCDDTNSAIDLVKRTQKVLKENGNVRLHKITSNKKEVLKGFDEEDIAKDILKLDMELDDIPLQRSLGIHWDLREDSFTFHLDSKSRPYTRRGVLSTINSLYDPLGFAAPVTIKGRVLLRNMMATTTDWDEPLPEHFKFEWDLWEKSLKDLDTVKLPRAYHKTPNQEVVKSELFVYCDASEKAIAAVAFIRTEDIKGNLNVGFVFGKSKVAPKQGHTIPRLELCASVLAIEVAEIVTQELSLSPEAVSYFTDSRVVLGYLNNQTRRFYVYVTNRVQRILNFSKPEQWCYIPTNENPADHGTRYLSPALLGDSSWLKGPQHIFSKDVEVSQDFDLIKPDQDREIRPDVFVVKSELEVMEASPFVSRITRFSRLSNLIRTVAFLRHVAVSFSQQKEVPCHGWHKCSEYKNIESYKRTETFLIKMVQHDIFDREIKCLKNQNPLKRDSPLISLSPILRDDEVLCVGGRLQNADIPVKLKNPILIPGKHHLALLIVRHFHEKVRHQGRHITEGAIREAGYWIIGGKRLVSSVVHDCVTCKKFRGKLGMQKMSELPPDRLTPGPPFTSVGVDCFGPWHVVVRKTRGGQANSKRWAVLFTCLSSRAAHIEVIEEMSTSSFLNALRRFISIRGKVQLFRSDRGTNFVGSTEKLGINIESAEIKGFLLDSSAKWIFNPPHASHMGGVWERIIGITRRILDSLLLDTSRGVLTHEVLTTFLAEVTAIINSRPLVSVSSDSEHPFPLSPSLILTQKSDAVCNVVIPSDVRDLYRAQWKRVQLLADMFWKRWRNEFLQMLQERRKWTDDQRDFKPSDVVLLRDKQISRNSWPMGIITQTFQSADGKIRTVEVRTVTKNGKITLYTRPIHELVLLIPV